MMASALSSGEVAAGTKQKRYYVRFSAPPFEEDMTHEFKGHRNLSVDELPRWTLETKGEKSSRKAVSRNLCGFLNTGLGGTVYCGIVDSGKVHGLKLTQYQRDHVVGSLKDLMERYTPPVRPHRYKVKFVPVVGPSTTEEERLKIVNYSSKEFLDEEERKRTHAFRTPHYCWCDKDSKARFEHGTLVPDYVVEFTILPWDPDNTQGQGLGSLLNLHPIHADEMGKVYFRRQGNLIMYTMGEISRLSRYDAKMRSDAIVFRLKQELAVAKQALKEKIGCDILSSSSSSSLSSF